MSQQDNWDAMWEQQERFMRLLQAERGFPSFPVDIEAKAGQRIIKEMAYECVQELIEAIQLLKNSKSHRLTDVPEINRAHYLEEIADVFHYLIEVAILSGLSREEVLNAYLTKGEKNATRINEGY
jgi:predicted house-cleaning noncanonical NTP pyrophosphatase (MazG superfamily)